MARRGVPIILALLMFAPAVWSQAPLGLDFQVNTYTTGSQTFPSVAADPAGNFMVVWDSYGVDGPNGDVLTRRYDATGTPLGAEFRVNSYTTGLQFLASVAAGPSDHFVVVWMDVHAGSVIAATQFDAIGFGPDFQVNTYTSDSQQRPSVAADAAGNFVVAWQGKQGAPLYSIWARRFSSLGVALGPDFPVNPSTSFNRQLPSVAMAPDGRFMVVWASFGQDEPTSAGVFGQRYDPAGSPVGAEFQVNIHTTGAQTYPRIAADAAGNFLVVWQSDGQDGDAMGVFGRRYNAAGTPGGEFQINTWTTAAQQRPAVTADATGAFVVVWQSYMQDQSLNGVIGRRFDALGPFDSEFRLNSYTTGQQTIPAVSADGEARFVAVFQSPQDGSARGIFGRRFTMDVIFRDGFEP